MDTRDVPARALCPRTPMPYWSIYCLYCRGYIADALLECVPLDRQAHAAYRLLFNAKPGAALACPYCNHSFGFDDHGQPQVPVSGWPVFRYGQAELEIKKQAAANQLRPRSPIGPCAIGLLNQVLTCP